MLKLLTAAALLSTAATPAAPPPAAPCVTRQQIADISVVTLASLTETVRNACHRHLPATAFLESDVGREFSGRMRGEARQRLLSAIAGIAKLTPSRGMTPDALRTMTEQGLAEGHGAELSAFMSPAICSDINEIMEISSELSPDQMGRFFGAFGSLFDNVLRALPPGLFGPAGAPIPPPPHGVRPATFDLFRTAPVTAPGAAARTPPRPFMCRDGE